MSAAPAPSPTPRADLDAMLGRLKEGSKAFAALSIHDRISLLSQIHDAYLPILEDAIRAGCQAKGIDPASEEAGEEWLAHAFCMTRHLRLLAQSLKDIARDGVPRIDPSWVRTLADGRIAVRAYPTTSIEAMTFPDISAEIYMDKAVTRENLKEHQASFYRKPDHQGKVALVLGAGNVPSIPPRDSLTKLFNEGKVVVLKMNPVNAYLGPFLEKAFRPAIEKGYFAVTYGGADEGAYLTNHPLVDEIHITGSDKTHDYLVWGPPGPDRESRQQRKDPLLKKEITSELGNISPVIVVPGPYGDDQIAYQGEHIGGMVANNASFNCNAAKLIVSPKGWDGREKFLSAIERALAKAPPRKAYYPGAADRFKLLTEGRKDLKLVGTAAEGQLPWAMITGVDASDVTDRVFNMEPWCSVLSETQVGSSDPAAFLDDAVRFVNDRVWGTLCATLIVHPSTLKDPKGAAAVEKAIDALRYGAVCVNIWPGAAYGMSTTPWGAHPSSTPENIQSGRGWVFNTLMLEGVEKVVFRAPVKAMTKLPFFPGHRTAATVGRRLAMLEDAPSWLKVPGIAIAALRG